MRVLVIGAAGMLGRKLVQRPARDAGLGTERISEVLLVDVVPTESVGAGEFAVDTVVADIAKP